VESFPFSPLRRLREPVGVVALDDRAPVAVDYVGHSSAYMTDRYRHLLEGTRVDAAAALDALLAEVR
jgi:hypothetical protein